MSPYFLFKETLFRPFGLISQDTHPDTAREVVNFPLVLRVLTITLSQLTSVARTVISAPIPVGFCDSYPKSQAGFASVAKAVNSASDQTLPLILFISSSLSR